MPTSSGERLFNGTVSVCLSRRSIAAATCRWSASSCRTTTAASAARPCISTVSVCLSRRSIAAATVRLVVPAHDDRRQRDVRRRVVPRHLRRPRRPRPAPVTVQRRPERQAGPDRLGRQQDALVVAAPRPHRPTELGPEAPAHGAVDEEVDSAPTI